MRRTSSVDGCGIAGRCGSAGSAATVLRGEALRTARICELSAMTLMMGGIGACYAQVGRALMLGWLGWGSLRR